MASSLTPAEIAYELEEARAAHTALVALIDARLHELDEMWRQAKPADRLLAVQRLLQTSALEDDVHAELETKNERVRELMGQARTERKRLERMPKGEAAKDRVAELDLRHKVLRLELEAQTAERERDELMDQADLRGPLYFCGETFVRTRPFQHNEQPLRDLAMRAKAIEARLKELQRMAPRTGARFTKKLADGREKTLIRMLPALSMESEPVT